MSNDDFLNDPIFDPLRKFGAQKDDAANIPLNIKEEFRDGVKIAHKRRYAIRGAIGAGLLLVTFPTLAAAKILPAPIQHFVEHVSHVIEAPVHHIFTTKPAKLHPTKPVREVATGQSPSPSSSLNPSPSATPSPTSTPSATPSATPSPTSTSSAQPSTIPTPVITPGGTPQPAIPARGKRDENKFPLPTQSSDREHGQESDHSEREKSAGPSISKSPQSESQRTPSFPTSPPGHISEDRHDDRTSAPTNKLIPTPEANKGTLSRDQHKDKGESK